MISIPNKELVGDLDVSGFTELDMLYCASNNLTSVDASNCPALISLDCSMCETLTSLYVTGSSLIQELTCNMCAIESLDLSGDHAALNFGIDVSDNQLSFLDVSGCPSIPCLECSNNNLTVLDVSLCTDLTQIGCLDNPLKEIKVNADKFGFESIIAVGNGTVACYDYVLDDRPDMWHIATADEGEEFIGWYDGEDNLLSEDANWMPSADEQLPSTFIAKFSETPVGPEVTLLGDADCNGAVNSSDALLVMRYSMGLAEITEQGLVNADMNGRGGVNTTDAILIMRQVAAG